MMIRNLKASGLALAALFSISAVVASGSLAAEIHSEKANVTITAKQTAQIMFSFPAGKLKCEVATLTGTQAATTATAALLTPTFEKCTLSGVAATVHVNGCTITNFSITALEPPTRYEAPSTLTCPAGKMVEITIPNCTIDIKAQPTTRTEFHNTGTGTTSEIDEIKEVINVHTTQTGIKCLGNGGVVDKTFVTSAVTGSYLWTATLVGVHVGIFIG